MCYSVMVKRRKSSKNQFAGDTRIFPGDPALIEYWRREQVEEELMRYGTYPPTTISDPARYTSFNARRDNLKSPFWANAFMKHHGFITIEAFYEWVNVKDLLRAGVVTIDQVKAEFAKQAAERKSKILAAGKKYKPTPTEQKPAEDRKIIIEFRPEDGSELLVPVIFSRNPKASEPGNAGFAIITDDPPLEVSTAGHDRCPIILHEEAMEEWLRVEKSNAEQMLKLLSHYARVTFKHSLPLAA